MDRHQTLNDDPVRARGIDLVRSRLRGSLGDDRPIRRASELVEEAVYTPLVRHGARWTIDYGGHQRPVSAPRLAPALEWFYTTQLELMSDRVGRLRDHLEADLRLLGAVLRAQLTMVSEERLFALLLACREARRGAFVECGVARGGCLAVMHHVARDVRATWGFDSFREMPDLSPRDGGEGRHWVGYRCGPEEGRERVLADIAALVPAVHNLHLVEGWVQETLPGARDEIGAIAVLRLDVDWFEATLCCLESLYDRVVPGGVVIIDDYGAFAGCRDAVDTFRSDRGIDAPLIWEDTDAVHWFAG